MGWRMLYLLYGTFGQEIDVLIVGVVVVFCWFDEGSTGAGWQGQKILEFFVT